MTPYILTLVFGAAIVVASIVGLTNHPETTVVHVAEKPVYRYRFLQTENRYKIVREENGIVELEFGGTSTKLMSRPDFDKDYERVP